MKKSTLLVVLVLLIVCTAIPALAWIETQPVELEGQLGPNPKESVEFPVGVYYHSEKLWHNNGVFVAEEAGLYTIYVRSPRYWHVTKILNIYDEVYTEKSGMEYILEIELEKGETCYFVAHNTVVSGGAEVFLGVCSPSVHCALSDEYIKYSATYTDPGLVCQTCELCHRDVIIREIPPLGEPDAEPTDPPAFTPESDMYDAPTIEGGIYYYDMDFPGGWTKFIPEKAGDHTFYVRSTHASHINIVNEYGANCYPDWWGTELDSKTNRYVGRYTVQLEAGKTYFIFIDDTTYEPAVQAFLSICTPSQHAVLGDEYYKQEPTCALPGIVCATCELCQREVVIREVEPLGHTPSEPSVQTKATCTTDGELLTRCTVCYKGITSEVIPATGHTEGERVVITESTCITVGEAGTFCTACNAQLTSEIIPMGAHIYGRMETVRAATCTEAGLREQHCTVCNVLLSAETPAALGHSVTTVTETPATCMAEGSKVACCAVCGETVKSEALPIVGHTAGEMKVVKPATCTEPGLNEQRCTVCNATLATETPAALGHTPGEWKTTRAASCVTDGERTQYCAVCNDSLTTEAIPAHGHTANDWQTTRTAACLQSGLKEQHCATCGLTLATEQISALGHTYSEWEVLTEATKDAEGERRRHCVNCGDTIYEVIPKVEKFLGIF